MREYLLLDQLLTSFPAAQVLLGWDSLLSVTAAGSAGAGLGCPRVNGREAGALDSALPGSLLPPLLPHLPRLRGWGIGGGPRSLSRSCFPRDAVRSASPVLPLSIHRSPAPFAACEPDAPRAGAGGGAWRRGRARASRRVDEVDAPLLHLEGRADGRGRRKRPACMCELWPQYLRWTIPPGPER
ncbi:unnamed protein product [Lepidochelys kempii]